MALCKRFDIKGFPTLLYFAERSLYQYSGARDLDSLFDYAQNGYKDAEASAVPGPPGWIDEMLAKNQYLRNLKEDFEHILDMRKDAAIVLIVGGLLVGVLFGSIMGSWGGEEKGKND